jgi:hypothetical protein
VDQLHKEKAAKEQQAYIKRMALFNQAQRDALANEYNSPLSGQGPFVVGP